MILTSSGLQDSNAGKDIQYSYRQLRAPDLVEDKQRTTEICHDLLEFALRPEGMLSSFLAISAPAHDISNAISMQQTVRIELGSSDFMRISCITFRGSRISFRLLGRFSTNTAWFSLTP